MKKSIFLIAFAIISYTALIAQDNSSFSSDVSQMGVHLMSVRQVGSDYIFKYDIPDQSYGRSVGEFVVKGKEAFDNLYQIIMTTIKDKPKESPVVNVASGGTISFDVTRGLFVPTLKIIHKDASGNVVGQTGPIFRSNIDDIFGKKGK